MQRIDIYGVRYCDIVLFVARILKNMQKNVLVCDRSISKPMRSFIPVFDEFDLDTEIFDYGGFGYTYGNIPGCEADREVFMVAEDSPAMRMGKNAGLADGMIGDEDVYDVMIVLNDAFAVSSDYWDKNGPERSICLFITDEYPENVYEMRRALKAVNRKAAEGNDRITEGKRIFVVRDYTGTARLIIDDLEKLAGASRNFLIPWSKNDRKLEMLAAYNDGFRFVGMSAKLSNLIEEIIEGLKVDTGGSQYRKAYVSAGRGKMIRA